MTEGSWFPLHIEESDQPSINYLHTPDRSDPKFEKLPFAKKVWIVIPANQSHHVELLMELLVPPEDKWCDNFLGHRYILANPQILTDFNIDYYLNAQEEGDFIIVAARAYHTGMYHTLFEF